MGAPLERASSAQVSFFESFAQPIAIRPSELVDAKINEISECEETNVRKRPSIVIGGDDGALSAVRVVHSPRSGTRSGARSLPPSPSATNLSPKVRGAWRRKVFGSGWTGPADAVLSVVALVATIAYYVRFLRWNESRTDVASLVSLSDPVLPLLPTIDCSIALSILVYGSLVFGFKYGYNKPDVLLESLQTHTLVIWIRMFVLYLTPLEAPVGTLPIADPIAYADGAVLVRDLFFSGHTATTFGVFIGVRRHDRAAKFAFGLVSLVTAIGVLIQKAHYTIDVVAAPFFVYAAHAFVLNARQFVGTALATPGKREVATRFFAPATKTKSL